MGKLGRAERKEEMKKFTIVIEYNNGRKNELVVWADDADEAKRLALKWWGNPTIYKSLTA